MAVGIRTRRSSLTIQTILLESPILRSARLRNLKPLAYRLWLGLPLPRENQFLSSLTTLWKNLWPRLVSNVKHAKIEQKLLVRPPATRFYHKSGITMCPWALLLCRQITPQMFFSTWRAILWSREVWSIFSESPQLIQRPERSTSQIGG